MCTQWLQVVRIRTLRQTKLTYPEVYIAMIREQLV